MSHSSWNRRDFLIKPAAGLAATTLLGSFDNLLAESPANAATPAGLGNAAVIRRPLGKTGITLPIVSMGVMNADIPGLLKRSYELGIRHFDTAAHYQEGRNELMIGNVMREMGCRKDVTISTKILPPDWGRGFGAPSATPQKSFTPAEVKQHFLDTYAQSLKHLQMDYVDILYNHAADSEEAMLSPGTVEALQQLKKEGRTRFIGFSSHRPELALNVAMKSGIYDVVLITVNYTMANDAGFLRALDAAAKQGIGIVAMKTQSGGMMPPNPAQKRDLPPFSQTAMLKWVLQHEAITTAIPGYTRYEHLEQNFSVASGLAFTPDERNFLADKKAIAEAQFCLQCGECKGDCPKGVNIPILMRSHMYAVQYQRPQKAQQAMETFAPGAGLALCSDCSSCQASCRHAVDIPMKLSHLKELHAAGVLTV